MKLRDDYHAVIKKNIEQICMRWNDLQNILLSGVQVGS